MTYPAFQRFVCEKCGRITYAQVYSDCQIWVFENFQGTRHSMSVCPEHKAEWLRLTSDFLEDGEHNPELLASISSPASEQSDPASSR